MFNWGQSDFKSLKSGAFGGAGEVHSSGNLRPAPARRSDPLPALITFQTQFHPALLSSAKTVWVRSNKIYSLSCFLRQLWLVSGQKQNRSVLGARKTARRDGRTWPLQVCSKVQEAFWRSSDSHLNLSRFRKQMLRLGSALVVGPRRTRTPCQAGSEASPHDGLMPSYSWSLLWEKLKWVIK